MSLRKPKEHEPRRPRPKMWDDEDLGVKQRSMQNEARLSKEIGFKLTPGSGNLAWPGCKGDGSHPRFQFECKETAAASLVIGVEAIGKIVREARVLGKDPALVMSAYGIPEPLPRDWVAVPVETFRWMLSQLKEER